MKKRADVLRSAWQSVVAVVVLQGIGEEEEGGGVSPKEAYNSYVHDTLYYYY